MQVQAAVIHALQADDDLAWPAIFRTRANPVMLRTLIGPPPLRRPRTAVRGAADKCRPGPSAPRASPLREMRPFSSTTILSARRMVESRCAITITVRCSIRLASALCTSISDSVSRCEVASSRIRMGAFFSSARAMAMRCRWPPLRLSAAVADHGLVSLRQPLDELVRQRRFGGAADRLAWECRAGRRRCCSPPYR